MPDIEYGGNRCDEVLRSGRFVFVTGPFARRPTERVRDTAQLSAVLTRWCGQRTRAACDFR